MGAPYVDVDSFPNTAWLIADSDPPNASNFNTPHEATLNRTRWLKNRLPSLYYQDNVAYFGARVPFTSATKNTVDPGRRHAGTSQGFKVCSLSGISVPIAPGDIVEVSYRFSFYLPFTNGSTTHGSDIVPGVLVEDGSTTGIIVGDSVDLTACRSGGYAPNGFVYATSEAAGRMFTTFGYGRFTVGAAATYSAIDLIAAYDTADIYTDGQYAQGCVLSAAVWRFGL